MRLPGESKLLSIGVRQRSITLVREPEGDVRWMPAERTWGEYLNPTALEEEA